MIHTKLTNDANKICAHKGISLTQKRKNIFQIVLTANTPLSAYDIADAYKQTFEASMPTMSVYRILEFLSNSGLVHKLESTNKFIACSHLECNHEHLSAQFLICNSCSSVEEIALTKELHEKIEQGVDTSGFKLNSMHFELHGICKACR